MKANADVINPDFHNIKVTFVLDYCRWPKSLFPCNAFSANKSINLVMQYKCCYHISIFKKH